MRRLNGFTLPRLGELFRFDGGDRFFRFGGGEGDRSVKSTTTGDFGRSSFDFLRFCDRGSGLRPRRSFHLVNFLLL